MTPPRPTATGVAAQVLNGLGILFRGLPGVFVGGLLWFVALSALLFVLIVFNRPKSDS